MAEIPDSNSDNTIEGPNKIASIPRDISETFEQFSARAVKVAATRHSTAMTASGDSLDVRRKALDSVDHRWLL